MGVGDRTHSNGWGTGPTLSDQVNVGIAKVRNEGVFFMCPSVGAPKLRTQTGIKKSSPHTLSAVS